MKPSSSDTELCDPVKRSAWRSLLPSRTLAAALLLLALWQQCNWPSLKEKKSTVARSFPEAGPDRIAWFDCPDSDTTQCAFFTVPLNHLDPSTNETVSLALRKLPVTVSSDLRRGTIIINPGGPGGSGTEAVAERGPDLSILLHGEYDILSFDPRGVNLSSPTLDCFKTENLARLFQRDIESIGLMYEAQDPATDLTGPPTYSELRWAGKLDKLAIALDDTCLKNGTRPLLQAQSTAIAARDMRAIMNALGEKEGLQYWGFSYGTILGATFAAMFPDDVHRMVLDGVSDSDAYTNNFWDWGRSAMNYTNTTVDGFVNSCIEAGPSRCALAKDNSTATSVYSRISNLRERLREEPMAVATGTDLGTGIITTSAIQHSIFRALYSPSGWPRLAEALASAEEGDATLLFNRLSAVNTMLGLTNATDNVFGRSMDTTGSGLQHDAIACSDTDSEALSDKSLEKLVMYMREMGGLSISGQAWAYWIAQCRRWSFRASEVYRGPWTREAGLRKTKFPLLFVSMTADPVTPLSAAVKMSRGFGDSASLLIQDGFGHCSYAQPSTCTAKKVRQYFHGEVPTWGETCPSDDGFLFPSPDKGVEAASADPYTAALWRLARPRASWSPLLISCGVTAVPDLTCKF